VTTGSYRGVGVPVGTPDPIVRKLEKAFLEICKNAEYVETQKKGGYEPIAMGWRNPRRRSRGWPDSSARPSRKWAY